MTQEYATFGSFILFKEIVADELGHLYRAGELDRTGVTRTTFLRVFDGPHVPVDDLNSRLETANRVAGVLHAANVASNALYLMEDGVPAVAWDYMPAQPLGAVFSTVRSEGFPVPVDNALLIMEKLALALSAGLAVEVDGASLVHGFLHPGLSVVSNDGEAVVVGFGMADQLAGLLDHPESAAHCAPYLAPEILMTRTSSKRGDVYSLGAVLFHLLTANPFPVEAEEREGLLDTAVLAYDGEPIPDDIKSLLSQAVAPRPEDRFSSAADFKKELDKLLYGGTYSPTTFNLALFMDRLFRSEIEAEEKQKVAESQIDVQPYLKPEPEPVEEEIVSAEMAARGGGKGLWIGLSVILAAVVIAAALVVPKLIGPLQQAATPTPTPEEVAAQEQAEQQRLQAMIDAEVTRLMNAKEEEIRQELTNRQQEIELLQRQLREAETKSKTGTAPTAEDQRRAEDLRRQIAAAEEAKRQRETELEKERLAAAEDARRKAELDRLAQEAKEVEEEAEQPTPVLKIAEDQQAPEPTPAEQRPAAVPSPTAVPVEPPPKETVTIVENMFVDPQNIDTRAELLKQHRAEFSTTAARSVRRGVVILQATVNASGRVEAVKILRIDEKRYGIPEAVKAAAMKCVFKPATKNGIRVKTYASITYRYDFTRRR
jgi:TonB family protein